ncbi:MAG: ABC transporter ATP-binding protein [Bacillota bacterium]
MSQLICENLTLGYESTVVIKNLNFSINTGEYLCVIGDNGTGKSTLMKAILGLLKPISGSITWGEDCTRGEIGYLTQQSEVQREFPASVKEVVMSGFHTKLGFSPFYSKAQKAAALENMKKLRVDNLAKRCYRELSGGQQQRVLLARALCGAEKFLFLDEPVTGLDPNVSAEMYDEIQKLNSDYNITIMMISHDVDVAVHFASHILEIGENPFFGTREQYIAKKGGCALCQA